MKKLIFITLFLFSLMSYSQENFVFVSNNPYGKGVSVRWVSPDGLFKQGVNIYRKEKGADWKKIKLVIPPSLIPEGLSESQSNLYNSFLKMSTKEHKESFDLIFTLIESVKDYSYAEKIGVAYNDESAILGKIYQYKMEGITNNSSVQIGITEEIKVAPFTNIEPPNNFTLERSKKRTKIFWNNEENKYFEYKVLMKKTLEGEELWKEIGAGLSSGQITEAGKKYFIVIPTHKDTAYQFKIDAKGYFGKRSQMSEIFELKIIDLDPPFAPVARVMPFAKKKQVTISWDEPIDEDIQGYNILRVKDDGDSIYTVVNPEMISATDTLYVDKLSEEGIYMYRVQIIDNAGNISNTFPYMAEIYDVFPPAIPTNLKAVSDTGKLILSWDKVFAPDFRGYLLMRSVSDDDNSDNIYVPVSSSHIDTNYYVEEMEENVRNPFVYIVKSVDTNLNISNPSREAVIQLPDVTPPVAPFIKQTYEEDGGIAIKWMPNLETDLNGYNLYKRKKGDTAQFEQVNYSIIPPKSTVYVDKEADRGQFYEYKLEAKDKSDLVSKKSNTILAKLDFLELAGNILITKNKFSKNRKEVTIQWSTDSLINEPIVGTSVFKSYEGGNFLPITKVTNENKYKEKLEKTGIHKYQIRSFGERGNVIKSEIIEITIK